MYNRGIQPEQDECVSERMVNYCQEYVKVEVCGEVETHAEDFNKRLRCRA